MSQIIPTYLVDKTGVPIDGTNPLPTSGGGGGGTVDQGTSNADPTDGWTARLTDGSAFITPAKTGQLPTALGATTAAGSLSIGIATDQLSTLATVAKQPALGTAGTPSADVLSVQGVVGGTAIPVNFTPSGTQDVNLTKVGGSAVTLGQKTGANSLPVVLASDTGTLTVATNVTAGSTPARNVVNCSTAQILLAATVSPKVRKIYNRAGGAGSSIAVYDNGSGGTTNQFVGQLTTTNDRIDFGAVGCAVTNGITVVTVGGTPPFVTIVYR